MATLSSVTHKEVNPAETAQSVSAGRQSGSLTQFLSQVSPKLKTRLKDGLTKLSARKSSGDTDSFPLSNGERWALAVTFQAHRGATELRRLMNKLGTFPTNDVRYRLTKQEIATRRYYAHVCYRYVQAVEGGNGEVSEEAGKAVDEVMARVRLAGKDTQTAEKVLPWLTEVVSSLGRVDRGR